MANPISNSGDSFDALWEAFQALPAEDRQRFATIVLKQTLQEIPNDFSDEALVSAADSLFRQLDDEEAKDSCDGHPGSN